MVISDDKFNCGKFCCHYFVILSVVALPARCFEQPLS